MVRLATKSLLQDSTRFLLSITGVALATMLVLLLFGMYTGVNRQITAYMDNSGADVLVAQEGTRNFLGARSLLPATVLPEVVQVSGVRRAIPVISQYAVVDIGDRKEFSLLVGFTSREGGGPWEMKQGSPSPREGEVIADYAVARARGLEMGDRVEILGRSLEVVGLSSGTSSWMTGSFFMTFDDAAEIVATDGRPSFLLVDIEADEDAEAIAARIEAAVENVTVTPREEIDTNDRYLYARILNAPMGFMVFVASLIGAAVVGLTIFTAISERSREYGTLKAIGIRNRRLYTLVARQSLISSLVGSALGVILALGAARLIPVLNARFMVVIEPPALLLISVVSLLMGGLAAIVPVRAVALIEPAIAFRRGA